MAITYLVGPAYSQAAISSAAPLYIPMTGFLPGDLVMVFFATNRTSALRAGVGWTTVGNYSGFNFTFYKVIGENEPALAIGPSSGSGYGHAVTCAYRGSHYRLQVGGSLYSSSTTTWASNFISPVLPSGIMGVSVASVNTPNPVVLVPSSGVTEIINNVYSTLSHYTCFHKNITDTSSQNFSGTVANTSSKVVTIYCVYEALPLDSNLSLCGVGR